MSYISEEQDGLYLVNNRVIEIRDGSIILHPNNMALEHNCLYCDIIPHVEDTIRQFYRTYISDTDPIPHVYKAAFPSRLLCSTSYTATTSIDGRVPLYSSTGIDPHYRRFTQEELDRTVNKLLMRSRQYTQEIPDIEKEASNEIKEKEETMKLDYPEINVKLRPNASKETINKMKYLENIMLHEPRLIKEELLLAWYTNRINYIKNKVSELDLSDDGSCLIGSRFIDVESFIDRSFIWSNTPEGMNVWDNLKNR